MLATFTASLSSEWLKRKRSLTSWVVMAGGFFVPAILFGFRIRKPEHLARQYRTALFWDTLWTQAWESVAIMVLPMVIILVTTLIAQIEYRGNTWKQLHATPQPLGTIFLAKLVVVMVLVLQFLAWFTVGIGLVGIVPALLFADITAPIASLPLRRFLITDLRYFVDALPIVALQFLLAIRFRNVVVALGIGVAIWILALGGLSWTYNFLVPYSYVTIDYLLAVGGRVTDRLPASPPVLGFGVFLLLAAAGYVVYVTKHDRG